MLDLAGADAMRERTERTVGRRMAVAAHDGRARQREALLGSDDVDNALAAVELIEILDSELPRVLRQRIDLDARLGVGDAFAPVAGRDIVVDHRQRLLRRADGAAGQAKTLEGLRARHLMHEVAVDIEKAGAVRLPVDDMVVKNLVVEGARGHGENSLSGRAVMRTSSPHVYARPRPRGSPRAVATGFKKKAGHRARPVSSSTAAAPIRRPSCRPWRRPSARPCARRYAPTCRGDRADNRAWRAAPCRCARP